MGTLMGKSRGIAFVDSTTIKVCHIRRASRNKVFATIAKKSRSSMEWFFGFKLHLIVNDVGEIVSLHLSPANTDDRKPIPSMTKGLFGKLFGDKGYISKSLSADLLKRGLQLITNLRGNMQNRLIPLHDKLMLRKRFIIETINDQLKNISQIEHTRHRSPINFLVNLFSGLIAYCLQPKKPAIKIESIHSQLIEN
jgi:IS5 family transposase